MLVANGFFDESKGRTYAPADYASHGSGLFFVGVEANGIIYAYALNHATNSATRVATIVTGFPGVMGLEYDRDTGNLWATCDDGCGNTTGAKIDKFKRFSLTPLPAKKVAAPLIAECHASLECRVVDTRMVSKYSLFVLEVVHAWIDPAVKNPRTLHHRGYGSFMVAGDTIKLKSKMK